MKKETKKTSKNKKRKVKKAKLASFIFCVYSLCFLIFCLCFYGYRLVKYYRIYNPKAENGEKIDLLSSYIEKNNTVVYENDGLYKVNSAYLFKGENVDNYLTFAGLTWRILKINNDGTIDMVLDEQINDLKWNSEITTYIKSDIHKYLNDKFLSMLNTDYLVKTTICTDTVEDINKITCNKTNKDSYVKLISSNDYVNSQVNGKTFINDGDSLWTSDASSTKPWYVSESGISSDVPEETYRIKPVVTLNSTVALKSGTGKENDPFIIEEEKKELRIGSYVKLGEDTWIIYEKNKNNMKMISANLYNNGETKKIYNNNSNIYNTEVSTSLGYFLNHTYYESLSYKDLLLDAKWYTGAYDTSYEDITSSFVEAKVGTYTVADLKFNHDLDTYYMLTPKESGIVYTYGEKLSYHRVSRVNAIRPAISIKSTYKIKSGNGTASSPYELEV